MRSYLLKRFLEDLKSKRSLLFTALCWDPPSGRNEKREKMDETKDIVRVIDGFGKLLSVSGSAFFSSSIDISSWVYQCETKRRIRLFLFLSIICHRIQNNNKIVVIQYSMSTIQLHMYHPN